MSASVEFSVLQRSRATIKGNVTRIINSLSDLDNLTIDDVEIRKARLGELSNSFYDIQLKIDCLVDSEQGHADQEIEKDRFEEQYFNCAKLINQALRRLQGPSATVAGRATPASEVPSATSQNITVQHRSTLLPKIEIRPFDGNPLDWYSFHDTFKSLVHNDPNIPAVQKFYLLKNSLRGNVTAIIESLSASEENYTVAWGLLKQRCDKPRQIVKSHIKAILDLPEIIKESPINIRSLKEKALVHVKALQALGQPVDRWVSILIYLISQKLDKNTRRAWDRTLEDTHMPKFEELITFLNKQERGDDIEDVNTPQRPYQEMRVDRARFDRPPNNQKIMYNKRQTLVGTQHRQECIICKASHNIFCCEEFLRLSPRERSNIARSKKLCLNCLRNNHATNQCFSMGCKKCNKKHNTLLHYTDIYAERENLAGPPDQNANASEGTETIKRSHAVTYDSEVLLGTAKIIILDKNNAEHECRILLDGCSQCHFITEGLAERLKLKQTKISLPVSGLGQLTTRAQYTVKTQIRSKSRQFEQEIEFIALPTITGALPSRNINKGGLPIPKNIRLADPEFYKSGKIDALIGTTIFFKLLSSGQIKIGRNSDIVLQKTLLGWIVTGEVKPSSITNSRGKACLLTTTLEKQLIKFWEVEEIPKIKQQSVDEIKCENIFTNTTKRDKDGRYVVRLPFNEKKQEIGNSYNMALKRFFSLERKLSRDIILKRQYNEFLREYRDLHHMEDITHDDTEQTGYYIPHHPVVKESNASTKIRLVFDASAKSSTNIALNDALLAGPTIQSDLITLVMRFRLYNIVLAADLQKMYRQIKVDNTDAAYQKIIWRESENQPLRVFKLTSVTQGTTSASFAAARVLQQLAIVEGDKFPLAAQSLKNNFYVDDLLTGAETVEQATELKTQLIKLLRLGGFEFHKWASNNSVLTTESNSNSAQTSVSLTSESKKLLGIQWDSIGDTITYSVKTTPVVQKITKRKILSQIAQLFDPLGILGPVIVIAKCIMQELWKRNLNWDESVPQSLSTQWINFKQQLNMLNEFKIKRHIKLANSINVQLHGFADASESAYGACVYLRSIDKLNNCSVHLICAKSRIAPVKTITVPRLELCAALLLAKLIETVKEALQIPFNKIKLWSDSTIVLHWVKGSPHTLKTFVANRVAEIQGLTDVNDWHHVATEDNPADYISRGQGPSEFIKNKHWLHGPAWLSEDECRWHIKELEHISVPEQRVKTSLVVTEEGKNNENEIFNQFSCINRLDRFVAFCLRALSNKRSQQKLSGRFSSGELKNARNRIIKKIQQCEFAREIKNLKEGTELHRKSSITCLNPFLDKDDIIRVGGGTYKCGYEIFAKIPYSVATQ